MAGWKKDKECILGALGLGADCSVPLSLGSSLAGHKSPRSSAGGVVVGARPVLCLPEVRSFLLSSAINFISASERTSVRALVYEFRMV
jgi:hypothetical protein